MTCLALDLAQDMCGNKQTPVLLLIVVSASNPKCNALSFMVCLGFAETIPTWTMSCHWENICQRCSGVSSWNLAAVATISGIQVGKVTSALNSRAPQRKGRKWICFLFENIFCPGLTTHQGENTNIYTQRMENSHAHMHIHPCTCTHMIEEQQWTGWPDWQFSKQIQKMRWKGNSWRAHKFAEGLSWTISLLVYKE